MSHQKTRQQKEDPSAQYKGGNCFHCGFPPEYCECLEYEDEHVIIRATICDNKGEENATADN